MDKIINFVWDKYLYFHNKVTKEQVSNLLENYANQVIIVRDENKIKGIAFYLKLFDETLKKIENRILDITDINIAKNLLQEKGDNIHFIFLIADGIKTIIRGLKKVIKKENPITISWFSPDMKNFFIRKFKEVGLCHQLQQQ